MENKTTTDPVKNGPGHGIMEYPRPLLRKWTWNYGIPRTVFFGNGHGPEAEDKEYPRSFL